MEFFRTLPLQAGPDTLQAHLDVPALPRLSDAVVSHLTINRREHDPDFIESLEFFADSWVKSTQLRS
ncbi:MAG: hypothetical protein R6U87_09920 [Thiohalospira sp.]